MKLYLCECHNSHTWRTDYPQIDINCPKCGANWEDVVVTWSPIKDAKHE